MCIDENRRNIAQKFTDSPAVSRLSRRSSERRWARGGETRRAGTAAPYRPCRSAAGAVPKRPQIGRGSRPIGAGRWYTAVVTISPDRSWMPYFKGFSDQS
jgi:hypothetical protein